MALVPGRKVALQLSQRIEVTHKTNIFRFAKVGGWSFLWCGLAWGVIGVVVECLGLWIGGLPVLVVL